MRSKDNYFKFSFLGHFSDLVPGIFVVKSTNYNFGILSYDGGAR